MYSNGKPHYNEIVFTNEQIEDICKSYVEGESSVKLGKRYGVCHKKILRIVHDNNIEVCAYKFTRQYKINENYFDEINSQDKAYILGFLYADGHNGISKGTVSMSLQEEDKDILEEIRNKIGSEKELEYLDYSNKHDFGYNYKNQYRLNMFSAHMCRSLEKLGMVSNKSLVLEFPDIPKHLYSHFIRGYFDGDGSVNKHTGSFLIVSTKKFIEKIDEIIKENVGISKSLITESSCKNGITKNYSIHRKSDSKRVYEWLYNDAEMYLKRKRDIVDRIHF